MTYRDDNAAEINRLTNELAQANEDLERSCRRATHWRHTAAVAMIGSLVALAVLILGLSVRAPLSANTRGAAREFCDALAKQEREEREETP